MSNGFKTVYKAYNKITGNKHSDLTVEEYLSMISSVQVLGKSAYIFGNLQGGVGNKISNSMFVEQFKYVLFSFVGHSGDFNLVCTDDLEQIKLHVLSPSGICNMFTTNMYLYENDELFDIQVFDKTGNQEVPLSKQELDSRKDTFNLLVSFVKIKQ